eukprot:6145988-Prymnesium_polylepis.1
MTSKRRHKLDRVCRLVLCMVISDVLFVVPSLVGSAASTARHIFLPYLSESLCRADSGFSVQAPRPACGATIQGRCEV